jgi:outer membrane protein
MAAGWCGSAAATDWTISLGAQGRLLPTFPGSDRYMLQPYPLLDIRRTGTPVKFSAPRDSLSLGLFEAGPFRAGVAGALRTPRRESNDDDLIGLGDVGWVVELGGFAEFWPLDWLRLRGELRQGIGGHHGLVADLTADVVVPLASQWTLSAGPRLSLATDRALDPYFSITPAQAAASGLPVYTASGGVSSYGVGAQLRYQFAPRWAAILYGEYQHLVGGAADSPLVTQRGTADQATLGLGATYDFDIKGFDLPFVK